jgi:uncharacterized protein (DUF427 family)
VVRPQPIPPGPGQESVWDYPRPPRVEPVGAHVQVVLGGVDVFDSGRTQRPVQRVLETSHPPTYYLPVEGFLDGALRPARGFSVCEWKGRATYHDVLGGAGVVARKAAWGYPSPRKAFRVLIGCVAVYAGAMDACLVDGERVEPQPGGFYGGWVTSAVVGPFKGGPGSMGW